MQKKKAFTLAEGLITLGIIGVVAALTIPTLINNSKEKETVTAVKKAYATLSLAYTSAVQDYGPPDTWNLSGNTRDPNIIRNLLPYLKVSSDCIDKTNCILSTMHDLGGGVYVDYSTVTSTELLTNGDLINGLWVFDSQCKMQDGDVNNICAIIDYDINGLKKPNTHGIDVFPFFLTNDKIVPMGGKGVTSYTFNSNCLSNSNFLNNGLSCTAWVIYNENIDYLKPCGPSLSWSGPIKCN